MINCPKKHTPDIDRIEVTYLSSLYDDIVADQPLLAGIQETRGITLGHMMTEPRYTTVLLAEFGFYDLLTETGIDYIIADPQLLKFDNVNYFVIPYDLGYVISNYEGIRFAILSKGKDSLTIQDRITVEIVNQRSDVMWMIDPAFLSSSPMTYYFYIKNRGLTDTSTTRFETTIDTALAQKLHKCAENVQAVLEKSIDLQDRSFEEFTLNRLAQNEEVDIVLYPDNLFRDDRAPGMVTIEEFISAVACERQFSRATMSRSQVEKMQNEQDLLIWGELKDGNTVLYPVVQGEYLFDLLSLRTVPVKY